MTVRIVTRCVDMAPNIMVLLARRRDVVIFGLLIVFLPSIYAGTTRYKTVMSVWNALGHHSAETNVIRSAR